MAKKIYFCFFLNFLFLLLSCTHAFAVSDSWQTQASQIEQRYGIAIEFEKIEFPPYWKGSSAKWIPIPEKKRSNALKKLKIDLSHYDAKFLNDHLNKIFLIYRLSFEGLPYGGTNDHFNKWIYLQDYWLGDNAAHKHAMGFHHEFSSIVLKMNKNKFNIQNWKNANPPDFWYRFNRSTSANIKSGRTQLVGNKELYDSGFLCPYGTLTMEDDINTYAQYMLAKPAFLKEYMDKHPRILQKASMLNEFYRTVGHDTEGL